MKKKYALLPIGVNELVLLSHTISVIIIITNKGNDYFSVIMTTLHM